MVVLGIVGLWQRWTAMAIVGSFLGCIVVAVIISVLSPGFAERTILCAAVGWSLLLGAAFNGRVNRQRTPVAAVSLFVVLVLCLGTIQNIHASAVKQRWNDASADLAMVSTLNYPVVTFSYGAVADTLVEAYEPGLLDTMRLITVRDGELEKTLSNDTIPQKGITIADLDAGKLNELLPQTPDNDVIWYLYYQRRGEEFVRAGIERAGYARIINKVYDAPRGLVFLDLYARPGANLGDVRARHAVVQQRDRLGYSFRAITRRADRGRDSGACHEPVPHRHRGRNADQNRGRGTLHSSMSTCRRG